MSDADDLTGRINQARENHQEAGNRLSGTRKINISATVPPYRWTDATRRAAWRQLAEDPNSLLLDPQREEIRNRGYRGPQFDNPITGRTETTELSHEPKPRRDGGTQVVPRDPRDHAARDPHRHLPADERNLTVAQRDAIREAFWDRDGYREYDPRYWKSSTASNVAENAIPPSGALRGTLRGASKALGPVGLAFDAYSLHEAYEADGDRFGEEFKTTAGGVVGGVVGGAAMGAAVGSVVPGVGTVIGGVVGGIVGSMAGERIGEAL
jgi:hypothetical protein